MSHSEYDVAIVGFGPVGALTALLLAESGCRVAVYEASTEPVVLPRAVGLDGESIRSFQRIGRAAEIEALLQPPRPNDAIAFTNSKREPHFAIPMPGRGPNGWRETSFFDQPELEAQLRDFVVAHSNVDIFLGREAIALETSDGQASLEVRNIESGATSRTSAAYLIGCDGAASWVRRTLDIPWTSLGYDQDWLVVDIVVQDTDDLPFTTMQVCDPERLTTYVCVKDPNRRWEFQLVEGETREEMLEPERIQSLLDDWIARDRYSIRRAAVYQFHAATADHWREGRVLLAGDAAHQTPPFLGQGLNAGFRDAVNLGWKIPLVLRGVCDATLLDTYFEERDPHARDLVDWAVGIGKLMETLAAREAGRPDPYPDASQSDGYGQGRTAPPLRGGALMLEQMAHEESIGVLLRQPRVRAEGGDEMLFDEYVGPGFAVVGRTEADCAMSESSRAIFERLGGRCVALDSFDILEDEVDRVFESRPAVLIRPDRFVFGVVDETTSLDDLIETLAEKLSLSR
jgi:3-(3-hydroxy-phenyl)propionate hydroxylase